MPNHFWWPFFTSYLKDMDHIIIMLCVALQTSATFREGVFDQVQKVETITGSQQNTSAHTSMECGIK